MPFLSQQVRFNLSLACFLMNCLLKRCCFRHLIADHLGWFDSDDLTQGGKYKTIEALLAAKGEDVKRGHSIQVDKHSGEESTDDSNQSSRVEIGQIISPPSA